MLQLGDTAREIRESFGVSQKEAAERLGVTPVHLCNLERNKATPSNELVAKYREVFGIDLYVAAWCLHGDLGTLPRGIREATKRLAEAWREQLGLGVKGMRGRLAKHKTAEASSKSVGRES